MTQTIKPLMETVDFLADPDEPFTCPYDGCRTVPESNIENCYFEHCPQCDRHLKFWDEEVFDPAIYFTTAFIKKFRPYLGNTPRDEEKVWVIERNGIEISHPYITE